jgi:RES domain-containing protein
MATAWRIVKEAHAPTAFSGEGARLYGGRWNSSGRAVVYCSEHAATAALEILVHLRPIPPSLRFVSFRLTIPDKLIESAGDLAPGWRLSPPGAVSMEIGDLWIREQRSPVLAVPSAIVPDETNFLLNPAHRHFRQIRIGPPQRFAFDPRLLGR